MPSSSDKLAASSSSTAVSPNMGCPSISIGGSFGAVRNRSRVQADDDALANGLNFVATTDKPTMPAVLDHKKRMMEAELTEQEAHKWTDHVNGVLPAGSTEVGPEWPRIMAVQRDLATEAGEL